MSKFKSLIGQYKMRNEIGDRLVDFAVSVIKMLEKIPERTTAKKLSDQLIRCVTSVGANYEEAQGAESKKDFVHKLQIALKEMSETYYWLRIVSKIASIPEDFDCELDEARQLRAILSKSLATAQGTSKDR